MTTVKLEVIDDLLCVAGYVIVYRHPAGDVSTFSWPLDTEFTPEEEQITEIVRALYDERECGTVPSDADAIELPDGRVVSLEDHV